jgi:hypothetical protein
MDVMCIQHVGTRGVHSGGCEQMRAFMYSGRGGREVPPSSIRSWLVVDTRCQGNNVGEVGKPMEATSQACTYVHGDNRHGIKKASDCVMPTAHSGRFGLHNVYRVGSVEHRIP